MSDEATAEQLARAVQALPPWPGRESMVERDRLNDLARTVLQEAAEYRRTAAYQSSK